MKADPMARYAEVPPATASVVHRVLVRLGATATWMSAARVDAARLAARWRSTRCTSARGGRGCRYRDVADELDRVRRPRRASRTSSSCPLAEHPFGGSWGYQVTGYFAPTSRFGSPDDLRYLIDRLHQAGIGVIMDWVPGHFPKDDWALARFDGEPLYEHPDPRRGEQLDWGTYIFDFGRTRGAQLPRRQRALLARGVPRRRPARRRGRLDALPRLLARGRASGCRTVHGGRENLEAIGFLQEVNATAYKRNPGIVMIAEESTSLAGRHRARPTAAGLGFGFKWNMGWMNDSLQYIAARPDVPLAPPPRADVLVRLRVQRELRAADQPRRGRARQGHRCSRKMPGDHWQQLANMRAYLAYMWAHPGKQLLFMGQEFGQLSEWSEERGLDWWILDQPTHAQLAEFVGALNRSLPRDRALWQLDNDSARLRVGRGRRRRPRTSSRSSATTATRTAAARASCNFAGAPVRRASELGLPEAGRLARGAQLRRAEFGGSGVGNLGGRRRDRRPVAGRPASGCSRCRRSRGVVHARLSPGQPRAAPAGRAGARLPDGPCTPAQ